MAMFSGMPPRGGMMQSPMGGGGMQRGRNPMNPGNNFFSSHPGNRGTPPGLGPSNPPPAPSQGPPPANNLGGAYPESIPSMSIPVPAPPPTPMHDMSRAQQGPPVGGARSFGNWVENERNIGGGMDRYRQEMQPVVDRMLSQGPPSGYQGGMPNYGGLGPSPRFRMNQ